MKSPHEVRESIARAAIEKLNRPASVLVGFAGLLLLMAALVVDSSRHLRDLASRSAGIRKEYRERDALLDRFRTDVYHAGTLLRDDLFEPTIAAPAGQRSELRDVHERSRATLKRYGQLVLPKERESFQILDQRAESYWQSLSPALAWTAEDKRRLGKSFLRETVIPRRNALIELVGQANALNQRDTDSAEERIQALLAEFQRRLTIISSLALVLGGVLAVAVLVRVRHLEHDATRRFDEVQVARQDLRLLSDRLVKAQEEERRKLSRELHDDVGQSMSALLMELGRLESRLSEVEAVHCLLASIRRLAEDNVAKVRDLSLLLRPSMLDELGLVPALRWQAREVSRRTGLKVRMIADEIEHDLPEAHRTCVYRVVQEALHNCVRHSGGSEVRIVMHHDDHGLFVSVRDNGNGFDRKREKGLGLLGISERVRSLGGRLNIDSRPGEGVVLAAFFPLPASRESAIRGEVA